MGSAAGAQHQRGSGACLPCRRATVLPSLAIQATVEALAGEVAPPLAGPAGHDARGATHLSQPERGTWRLVVRQSR